MITKKKYKFVSEDTLMVRRDLSEGGDAELERIVNDLVKNKKAIELVKMMQPLDIANVVAKDLGLCPNDAAKVTVKIVKQVREIGGSGFIGWWMNRSTGKFYNVRNKQGKGIHAEFVEDNPAIFDLTPQEGTAFAEGDDNLELKVRKNWNRITGYGSQSFSVDILEPMTSNDIKFLQNLIVKNNIKISHIFIALFDSSMDTTNEGYVSLDDLMVAKNVRDINLEGLSLPSIETNKEYPVPSKTRRDNTKEEGAGLKTDITPKFVFSKHQFPPEPREKEDEEWPYDDMTTAGMKPGTKSKLRPLTTGKNKKYIFKQDLALNQPGGAGKGIYQTNRGGDGNMAGSGTSWSRQGSPGWSRSLSDKEFDLPGEVERKKILKKDLEDLEDPAPVGSAAPQLGYGGRNPGRRMGFRRR